MCIGGGCIGRVCWCCTFLWPYLWSTFGGGDVVGGSGGRIIVVRVAALMVLFTLSVLGWLRWLICSRHRC